MAAQGYMYRGQSTYSDSQTDDWRRRGYVSDRMHQPAIGDVESRKRMTAFNCPSYETESYVISKTETTIKPCRDYGAVEDGWRRTSSLVHDRPQQVDQFLTKVQTEASRPNMVPQSASHWRQSPNSTGYHANTGYGGYGGDRSYVDYGGNKSSGDYRGNATPNNNYNNYYCKNEGIMEPNMVSSGGWVRPSRETWSGLPEASLTKPTGDIGTAMEILKEATKPSSVSTAAAYSRHQPVSAVPQRDSYTETIDNREASRRYGNFNLSSRPVETYTGTIDNREAARKYKGAFV